MLSNAGHYGMLGTITQFELLDGGYRLSGSLVFQTTLAGTGKPVYDAKVSTDIREIQLW